MFHPTACPVRRPVAKSSSSSSRTPEHGHVSRRGSVAIRTGRDEHMVGWWEGRQSRGRWVCTDRPPRARLTTIFLWPAVQLPFTYITSQQQHHSTSSLDCHAAEIGLRNKEKFKLHLAHTLIPLSTLPSSVTTAARDGHATETLTTPPPAYLTHSLEAHQRTSPLRPRLRPIPQPRRPCHIWPRRCTRSSTSTTT